VLTPQEFREQADLCIDRARIAGSAAERKLYRRLALRWLEIVIQIEPRAIELRDADAAAFTVRTYARGGDQSRKNPLSRPGVSAV
jgi:hypothetical protein